MKLYYFVLSFVACCLIAATPSHSIQSERRETKTGFEEAEHGTFKKLSTNVGTWIPFEGSTIVDNQHAKSGKHCLQLKGGKKTSVILDLSNQTRPNDRLTFWAERWTRRQPFSFRIEKQVEDEWKEIYNGDQDIRVGRAFLSHVKISLGNELTRRLRFSVSSPPNTGILIDDLRITPVQPQKIVKIEQVPFTLPALVGANASPLAKLNIETAGELNAVSVSGIQAKLIGTLDPAAIESVMVMLGHGGDPFRSARLIGRIDKYNGQKLFTIKCDEANRLVEGNNTLWLAAWLKKGADVDARVGISIESVRLSNDQTTRIKNQSITQRLGVAVRQHGDDGVHTFRIPGLATTNKGTLIGVYDIRRRGGGDLPGDIDVGMSRSTDGGRTWEPMKVIMDMGNDPKWLYDGIGDPAILVDKTTGTIWVAATWSHGNRSWRGSGPGLTPEETGQLMLVRSDDDGVTWSKPINITKQVKRPEWCFILQGPGKGITMRDGTIVFPAQYQDPPDKRRLPHSTIIYSKDHGKTWHVGTGAFDDTTEAQVVEVTPGVLMLNCRYNRKSVRVVMTTRDMGKTWQKHPTTERALIEPRACMASLIDVDREVSKDAGGWLLFSNPDSLQTRRRIMIKASRDRGMTWPKEHHLLLDEERGAGYSCMTMINEKTVGILYEGSQAHMTFQRIPLDEITGKIKKEDVID